MNRGLAVRAGGQQHAVAQVQRLLDQLARRLPARRRAWRGLVQNSGHDFYVVLAEAFQPERFGGRIDLAVGADFGEAVLGGPMGDIRVKTLAIFHHRREQQQIAAPPRFRRQPRCQLVARLRPHRPLAVRTILRAQPGKQQAQEMINLRDSGDGALAPAPRDALLDAHRGRNAGDQVHLGPRQLLDELPGVSVHRVQKTALSLRKQQVKGQRAFARSAHARDHHELVARDGQRNVLQVVFARPVDRDHFLIGGRLRGNCVNRGRVGKGRAGTPLPAVWRRRPNQCRTIVVRRAGDCPPYQL